jgi:hypothetical protein
MNKVVQEPVVDGYPSGVVDFAQALGTWSPEVRNAYDFLITVATAAIANPDATCVLPSPVTRIGSTRPA